MALLRRLGAEKTGATMMEYAVLIATRLIAAVGLFGDNLGDLYQDAVDELVEASGTSPGPP